MTATQQHSEVGGLASATRGKPVSQWTGAAVWTLRILTGAVFVFSGFAKSVDPWGGMLKVEEYLAAMGLDLPRALSLIGSSLLALSEFTLGVMTLTGSFRRMTPVFLCAFMTVMLPLSLWIYIADPVSDCGCFGDAVVISNGATFLKNIVLCAMSVGLLLYNRRVRPLYAPGVQVWALLWSAIYATCLILIGYNRQPLVDFRPFPAGTRIVGGADTDPRYIYERNGVRTEFSADSLPDESDGWIYVARTAATPQDGDRLAVFDTDGDDATDEISEMASGKLLILSISEPRRHGISRSYQANQLYDFMRTRGDSMIAIVATSRPDVWKKAVRARYPVYTADDTELKELARGEASLVYVSDDTIRWKTSLTAISPELLNGDSAEASANALLNRTSGDNTLRALTSIYAGMMLLTLILGIWPEQGRFWRRVRL